MECNSPLRNSAHGVKDHLGQQSSIQAMNQDDFQIGCGRIGAWYDHMDGGEQPSFCAAAGCPSWDAAATGAGASEISRPRSLQT
jgi:hypothetical protein